MDDKEEGQPSRQEGRELSPVIEKNLQLLKLRYYPPREEAGPDVDKRLSALTLGESMIIDRDPDTTLNGITITYNTRTGEIGSPGKNSENGDFSVLRTWVEIKGEQVKRDEENNRWLTIPGKYWIVLYQPGDNPMPHQITNAIENIGADWPVANPLESEGRRVLPQRIIPELVRNYGNNIMGKTEKWGESELIDDASGDLLLWESLELFNERFREKMD